MILYDAARSGRTIKKRGKRKNICESSINNNKGQKTEQKKNRKEKKSCTAQAAQPASTFQYLRIMNIYKIPHIYVVTDWQISIMSKEHTSL